MVKIYVLSPPSTRSVGKDAIGTPKPGDVKPQQALSLSVEKK